MIWITFVVCILYLSLMLWLFIGNSKLPETKTQPSQPTTSFTIVVPFRNEAQNLLILIESLRHLNYPHELCEIVFVDDDSSDGSAGLIKREFENKNNPIEYSIFKNEYTSGSPKKDAITLANKKAKNSWIITTDADCQVPKNWLLSYNDRIVSSQAKLICGPVATKGRKGTIEEFQQLEGLSLQSVTWAGFGSNIPFLCNGANMAYPKETFIELNGYLGNDHIASGDDVFLLEKAQNLFPEQIEYLKNKDAIVLTKPVSNWHEIIKQRQRWAGKTKNQKNRIPKLIGLAVFTINFWVVFGLIAHLCWRHNLLNFAFFLALKLILDGLILVQVSRFFGIKLTLLSYFKTAIIYPPLTLIILARSFSHTNDWKGRSLGK